MFLRYLVKKNVKFAKKNKNMGLILENIAL
jgi:hypothetical protein